MAAPWALLISKSCCPPWYERLREGSAFSCSPRSLSLACSGFKAGATARDSLALRPERIDWLLVKQTLQRHGLFFVPAISSSGQRKVGEADDDQRVPVVEQPLPGALHQPSQVRAFVRHLAVRCRDPVAVPVEGRSELGVETVAPAEQVWQMRLKWLAPGGGPSGAATRTCRAPAEAVPKRTPPCQWPRMLSCCTSAWRAVVMNTTRSSGWYSSPRASGSYL